MFIIKSTLCLIAIIFYRLCLHILLYDFHISNHKKHNGAAALTNRKFLINFVTCSSMEKCIFSHQVHNTFNNSFLQVDEGGFLYSLIPITSVGIQKTTGGE